MSSESGLEEWRDVVGYEGLYSVSNLGRVRRERSATCTKVGRILATPDRGNGYPFVQLCRDNQRRSESVHRLVAFAFLGVPSDSSFVINHKDGDRANPRPENLEWVPQSANVKHGYETGLSCAKGARNGQAKLTTEQVISIRNAATGAR